MSYTKPLLLSLLLYLFHVTKGMDFLIALLQYTIVNINACNFEKEKNVYMQKKL